jgi:hypothetical protein
MDQVIKSFTLFPKSGVHRIKNPPAVHADTNQSPERATPDAGIADTVEDEALRWFREEVVPEYVERGEKPRIDDVQDLALERYSSLTGRAFYLKVWSPGAPKPWLKGGRPKGPPRKQKARRR